MAARAAPTSTPMPGIEKKSQLNSDKADWVPWRAASPRGATKMATTSAHGDGGGAASTLIMTLADLMLRVSVHRERSDRAIVNTKIGAS